MFNTWPVRVPFEIMLLLCFSVVCKAESNVFLYSSESNNFSPHYLSYYIDSGNKLLYEDIAIKYQSGAFQKCTNVVPNLGYTRSVAWFHLAVKNASEKDELIFEVDFAQFNEIEIFIADSGLNIIGNQKQGIYNLQNHKEVLNRCPLFYVNCLRDSTRHLFFRIINEAPVIFPIEIYTNKTYIQKEKLRRELSYSLFGLLIATILYNLIFFFITKNKSYIYLSFHLLFSLGNFIFYMGYGYEYFPLLHPDLLIMLKFHFFTLSGLLHLLFFINYLELKRYKIFYRITQINLGFYMILFVAGVLGLFPVITLAQIIVFTYLFAPFINMSIAFLLFKNSRNARYYTIAYSIHVLSAFIFTLTTIGVLPFSVFNLNIQVIAMVLLGILLSIGLTEQFTLTKVIKATNLQLEKHNKLLKTEIEEHIKTQEALSESENKFRLLFELLPHPALLTDIETGLVMDINKAVCTLSGYEKEELLNFPTTELGFWDIKVRSTYIQELVRNGKISGRQMVMKMKNNRPVPVLLYSDVIIINNVKKLLTLVVDISDLKKKEQALEDSEKKLRQLNKTKDKFFSVIAHDLQNPLNVLMAYSKELINHLNVHNATKVEEYSQTIKRIAENTNNLIQNLLSWARIQTGLIKYHPEFIRALSLLENELLVSGNYFKNKNIAVRYHCPDGLIIKGDVNMLGTVLRNLLSNALKFTPEGGAVTIKIDKEAENYFINVTDTGIGIQDNIKRNLFKIGEIVNTKGTNDELGTGLGLILCAEFVSLHKGIIDVESASGKGSSFTVKWPEI